MCPLPIIRILAHSDILILPAKLFKVCLTAEQAHNHASAPTSTPQLTEIKPSKWLTLWIFMRLCSDSRAALIFINSCGTAGDLGFIPHRSLSSPPLFWECRAADTTPPLGAAGEFPCRSSWPAEREQNARRSLFEKGFNRSSLLATAMLYLKFST